MTEVITRPQQAAKPANPGAAPQVSPESGGSQPAAEPTSASLIVLTLRPNGTKFNGDRIGRAQEAGFGWLENGCRHIGLGHPDTGEEIARHVVKSNDEAHGALKEIQVHIDPEQCSWMWKAGTYLMKHLEKYAILIGAHICDGLGLRLDDDSIDAITGHIDGVMEKRRDADKKARMVTLPSGERRESSELSFVYTVLREAGAKRGCYRGVYFDAPALHYHEGRARGMQMAGEIMQFYRRHKQSHLPLRHILREVMQSGDLGYGDYKNATAANVASGFLDVIVTMIEVGARNLNPAWLQEHIEQSQQAHVGWSQRREQRKAEFIERMRNARAAKKAGGAV